MGQLLVSAGLLRCLLPGLCGVGRSDDLGETDTIWSSLTLILLEFSSHGRVRVPGEKVETARSSDSHRLGVGSLSFCILLAKSKSQGQTWTELGK